MHDDAELRNLKLRPGYMVDFDELIAWPGRSTHIVLGRVIHEIKSGWAPPSLHVDLFRAQGCEPAIYTMAEIDRFAAMSEFKAWLLAHELASFDELVAWPGRGTRIALGRVIHEIKSGWAPPSLHVDLNREQGCDPSTYTMADVDLFASLPEFEQWLATNSLSLPNKSGD
jgi:hypothetical protein